MKWMINSNPEELTLDTFGPRKRSICQINKENVNYLSKSISEAEIPHFRQRLLQRKLKLVWHPKKVLGSEQNQIIISHTNDRIETYFSMPSSCISKIS